METNCGGSAGDYGLKSLMVMRSDKTMNTCNVHDKGGALTGRMLECFWRWKPSNNSSTTYSKPS